MENLKLNFFACRIKTFIPLRLDVQPQNRFPGVTAVSHQQSRPPESRNHKTQKNQKNCCRNRIEQLTPARVSDQWNVFSFISSSLNELPYKFQVVKLLQLKIYSFFSHNSNKVIAPFVQLAIKYSLAVKVHVHW